MKSPRDILSENLVSNLTKLTTKDIERLFPKSGFNKTKVFDSKYINLVKGTNARYGIITFDDIEGKFVVSVLEISNYVNEDVQIVGMGQAEYVEPEISVARIQLKKLR